MLIRARSVLWFPVVFVAVLSASAQPQPRDVWYAFLDGDHRYGYQRMEVSELQDGNYRYYLESRFLVDPFGSRSKAITAWGDYVVTPDLELVSVQSELNLMSDIVTTTGEVVDGTLSLSITSGGDTKESTIQMRPEDRVVLDLALEDWLASLPRDDETSSRKILDSQSWAPVDYTAIRTEFGSQGSTWEIQIADSPYLTLRCDEQGLIREATYRAPIVHVVRCTEEEAKEIHPIVDERDLLVFPVDKEIAALHRLTSLTVKLSWKDIPFEEFELEDRRQRLVEKFEDDGRYTAVLRISSPASIEESGSYPMSGEAFGKTLAESDYVKPDHEEIAKTARKVVQGQDTALEAVLALSEWVHGYIEGVMIPETLTGPEVLARKTGKCTEYSTLFASLARSVGIPTRMALGERMVQGKWMGHMWNEAYVGEWIPVDTTVDEVGASFALLKFIHSDTVAGTQPLRWKLPESLKIEVIDSELISSPLESEHRTGVENGTYTNIDFACRVTSPDPTWKIEPKTSSPEAMVRFRIPDKNAVIIHFLAYGLPEGTDPKLILDGRLQAFRSGQEDLELLRDESREVNGAKAWTTRFNYRVPGKEGEAARYRVTEVVWTRGSFGYLLNLIAPAAEHDEVLANFEKLVTGFEDLSR